MDDGTGTEYVQLTTKSGAQIKLDETNGFVYLINRDGTAWVQMDQKGNVDIFGAMDVSMRAQRDFNIRADRNVNIEAGQNIFIKAAKDTTEGTTTFTYDVNNIPQKKTIPVWTYKGEGKGTGGNIVMQALNNWQSTTKNTAYLTVIDNNMNVKIGNNLNVTTVNGGQNFNSSQGIAMTSQASFDLSTVGNIRVGSKGQISVVGISDIILCTNANLNLKAASNIQVASGGDTLLAASNFGVTAPTLFSDTVGVVGLMQIAGGLSAAGPVQLGGSVPVDPPTSANPAAAEAALSAGKAAPAEIKPLNDKINILATWSDPVSKFKRNSEALQTTVSRFPTYEPCPEHETFSFAKISGYTPKVTPDATTYEGSGGSGNSATASPPPAVNPGANNTSVAGDPPTDSAVTKDFNTSAYQCQLKIHEGVKYASYLDSVGLPTGGIGHLLRSNEISQFPIPTPISESQVESWFQQDAPISITGAQTLLGISTWGDLSDIRKRACADLCYNLGQKRLSKFVNFIAAMKASDYNAAGTSLRNSVWFTQVGRRGPNIITMIVQNIDPNGCDKKFLG
jgi:lysozyme